MNERCSEGVKSEVKWSGSGVGLVEQQQKRSHFPFLFLVGMTADRNIGVALHTIHIPTNTNTASPPVVQLNYN